MQPKFEIPSRVTIARDVISLYLEEKKKMQMMFSNCSQQICLTTDTWTSIQNINYMVLTAHYIDDEWNLQKKILNFESVPNHRGETIGKMIEACLIAWGIERVFTITVDNASSNDVAISYMKKKVRNWGKAVLDCNFIHMRCCAHILNLVVHQGLKDYDNSIQVIRNGVRYVRSSPSRLHKFKECVEKEKLDVAGSVCLDVATRWNSTFLMLESAIKFRRAFERMEEDVQYKRYCEETLELGPPNDRDWDAANNFMKFLALFYEVTNRFSGSLYVTSNAYFHDLCSMYTHITSCIKESDLKLSVMASEMKQKFDKYWGDLEKINPLLFVAVVLDPRYKQDYVDWSFKDMYEDNAISSMMSRKVKKTMKNLYDHYSAQDPTHEKERSTSRSNTHSAENFEDGKGNIHEKRLLKFKSFLKAGENGEKTELERYLVDPKESMDEPFDLLGWWKMNSTKYKVLSRIAKDVLAIPVSTVSSESAFSTGGRVLDPFRSTLSPKTVQALICLQNWLRTEVLQDRVDIHGALQEIEELEKIEKDFTKQLQINTDHIE